MQDLDVVKESDYLEIRRAPFVFAVLVEVVKSPSTKTNFTNHHDNAGDHQESRYQVMIMQEHFLGALVLKFNVFFSFRVIFGRVFVKPFFENVFCFLFQIQCYFTLKFDCSFSLRN